jgi:hypothetical protein
LRNALLPAGFEHDLQQVHRNRYDSPTSPAAFG